MSQEESEHNEVDVMKKGVKHAKTSLGYDYLCDI